MLSLFFKGVHLFWLVSYGRCLLLDEIDKLTGCSGEPNSHRGFMAKFYSYPYESDYYLNNDFYIDGYQKVGDYLGSVEEVIDVRIDKSDIEKGEIGSIYGKNIELSNFTIEFTGYYYSSDFTGWYNFITSLDPHGKLSVQLGANKCCSGPDVSKAVRSRNDLLDNSDQIFVNLSAGQYYPFRMIYVHTSGSPYLSLEFNPNDVFENMFHNIYQLDVLPQCMIKSSKTTIPREISSATLLNPDNYVSNTISEYDLTTSVSTVKPITTSYTTRYQPWTGTEIMTRYFTSYWYIH